MNEIPIFDSLTHPTVNGDWLLPHYSQKSIIDNLLAEMEANNVYRALAVGMDQIGNYSEAGYHTFISSKTDKLLPIAYFTIGEKDDMTSVVRNLKSIKRLKYLGIKLHPRFGRFSLLNPLLPELVKAANDMNLAVLLCTYYYETGENASVNNIENLLKFLTKIPNEKILLLHSGSVRLLETVEIARAFKNILLDLSFTLVKYANSSIDMDINYLFNTFDQRICVGSDFPQFSIAEMRNRFDMFSKDLPEEKAINIAHKNLTNFLGSIL